MPHPDHTTASSPTPVAALDLTGEVILVSREAVQFLASTPPTEERPGEANLVTITGLPQATLRALAQRYGESMPCVIRFG